MPPPKRPFTTSSLTSTLKSTFANQPLLNNLTNIDKLSSQASSLAQKTPFFGAINQQFQQHHQQGNQPQDAHETGINKGPQSQANVAASSSVGVSGSSSSSGSDPRARNNTGISRANEDMFRDVQATGSGSGGRHGGLPPPPPMASTPTVDMSHLTEEERAMIQSVMAKAEMADMGLPVDTSMPSSTNLPSNTSQALTQQRDMHQKHQQMQQQQKQLIQNSSLNTSGPNQNHQSSQQMQQQQQHQPQQQQQQIQQHHQAQQPGPATNQNLMNQPAQHSSETMGMMQQQQQQQQPQLVDQSSQLDVVNQLDAQSHQLRSNQGNISMMYDQSQVPINLIQANDPMQGMAQDIGRQVFDTTNRNPQQAMDLQPAQQMNDAFSTTFNGEHPNQNLGFNVQQQPQQQQLPYSNNNNINQALQDQIINNKLSVNNGQQGNMTNLQRVETFKPQNNQYGYQDPIDQTQAQMSSPYQTMVGLPQAQTNQGIPVTENIEQLQQQISGALNLPMMASVDSGDIRARGPDYMAPGGGGPMVINQQMMQNELASGSMQNDIDLYQQNAAFGQGSIVMQPVIASPAVKPRLAQRTQIETLSDFEYEHAYSDDQRARLSRRSNRSNQATSSHHLVDTDQRASRRNRDAKNARDLRDTRDLQAHDLARQRPNSTSHQASRRLPRPGCSNPSRQLSTERSLQSSSEYLPDERPKVREAVRSPRRRLVETSEKSSSRKSKRAGKSRQYQTESDLDEDSLSASDGDENQRQQQQSSKSAEDAAISKKEPNVKESSSPKIPQETSSDNKSEQALKLLNELKLSEQANQVMEQQQLLIKQSQELIKLQQAQLEQQAEITKALKDSDKRDTTITATTTTTTSTTKDEDQSEVLTKPDEELREINAKNHSEEETSSTIRSIPEEMKANTKARLTNTDKNKTDWDGVRPVREIDERTTSATRSHEDNAKKSDRESLIGSDYRNSRRTEKSSESKRPRPAPNTAVSRLVQAQRSRERDLFQSPTDTTDSDADLVSQSSSRLRHQKQSSRSVTATRVRREPKGLPPSPLPVAAAIQLHQMQQKHKIQTETTSNLARANYLRSRSVTSSPNHLLDRTNSGYMTDDQRRRPTSPDTLSEYGGLRRRKRLPQPPVNVVPITPSMVRRLVQANRAAAANQAANMASSSKLQSYLTTTTNPVNNPYPNYGKSSFSSDKRTILDSLPSAVSLSDRKSLGYEQSSILRPHSLGRTRGAETPTTNSILSDISLIGKPSSSLNYCNSIIRNSEITDIKETPELDKLISNLDAYYNLDGLAGSNSSPLTYGVNTTKSSVITDTRCEPAIMHSDLPYVHTTRSSGMNFGSQRGYQARPYSSSRGYSLDTHDPMLRQTVSDLEAYPFYSSQYPVEDPSRYTEAITTGPITSQNYVGSTSAASTTPHSSRPYATGSNHQGSNADPLSSSRYPSLMKASHHWHSIDRSTGVREPYIANTIAAPAHISQMRRQSEDSIMTDLSRYSRAPMCDFLPQPPPAGQSYNRTSYVDSIQQRREPEHERQQISTNRFVHTRQQPVNTYSGETNCFAPLTKDDIINNGPKFDSIGYRFRTESQNKYVTGQRTSIDCLQSKYQYPYKRILLSKNPKDRIGNGIGVRIVGGQPIPNVYDKVNKCIVTSGAFVTEVFQSSRVYFMDEMHEGDQIIEWNGVNLCNRSDGEVQQILLSQFSDDEVEIIYLNRNKFYEAYGIDHERAAMFKMSDQNNLYGSNDTSMDDFSRFNKPTGSKKTRPSGRGSFFLR